MLSYYHTKMPPGYTLADRSGSPSKQKSELQDLLPPARKIIISVWTLVAVTAVIAVIGHRQSHNTHQLVALNKSKMKEQAKSLATLMEEHNTCRVMQANTNKTLTTALEQCHAKHQQLQDDYSITTAAANKTLADLKDAMSLLDKTKAALAALQLEHKALSDLHLQDRYTLIIPGKQESADASQRQLLDLANEVAITTAQQNTAGSPSSREVVLVMCDTASTAPEDIMFPWCQSALLAGVNNTVVLAGDMTCMMKVQEAGLRTLLYNNIKVPIITGQYAGHNAYAYQKYTAVKTLLSQGYSVLAVEPDMMLVGDPYPYLQHSAFIDMEVVSDALDDDSDLAYGRDELHEDPTSHKTYHSVQVAGLNPGLMHLKPNKACLEFVEAMLQGLQFGSNDEHFLLDQLLLTPLHAVSTSYAAPALAGDSAEQPAAASHQATEQLGMLQLSAPPRVRVLPVNKFTTSTALLEATVRSDWLKRHAPAAIHILHEAEVATYMRAIVASYRGDPEILDSLRWPLHQDSHSSIAGMLHPVERVLEKLGLE